MTTTASHPGTDTLPRNRLTSAFERRVARVLDTHVPRGETLVVAASGGPDSTAALVATARAAARRESAVVAACFDHRMRPAADTAADRAFLDEVAAALGVEVRHGAARGARPRGEARAREARYRWLARVCATAGAGFAVTGHTVDDQAETVLLRLTRGAGLAGASGMAECAPWPVGGAAADATALPQVVRPLLGVTRAAVLEYVDALELTAREDATNEVLEFDRNRVRHRVLSELRRVNPRAPEQIARFARLARADEEALAAWAERAAAELVDLDAGGAEARVDRRALVALPAAVGSRVLRQTAERVGLRLDAPQVEQLMAIARQRGAQASLAGGGARTDEAWLVLRRAGPRGRGNGD